MAEHNELGRLGEAIALAYLEDNKYKVLERNWKRRRHEIDIIAKIDTILVFVEVKTRKNNQYGMPEESVDAKKEKLMIQAASMYCQTIDYEEEIRFDVLSITMEPTQQIVHFEDAFFPGWDEE